MTQDYILESIQGYNNNENSYNGLYSVLVESLISPKRHYIDSYFFSVLKSSDPYINTLLNINGSVGNETCSHTDIKKAIYCRNHLTFWISRVSQLSLWRFIFSFHSSTTWAESCLWREQNTAQMAGMALVSSPPPAACYANDSLVGLSCLPDPALRRLARPSGVCDLKENI